MKTESGRSELKVLDGNKAAAHAVLLCKPDVVAIYPITPQTTLLEQLCQFKADGLLQAELVEVEGENSAMSVSIGTSAAGGRAFTSTSSMGLAFMYDTYLFAAGQRVPMVMAVANREAAPPHTVSCGQQDTLLVKDCGWIQFYVENCQEIFDAIIMAYRLSEDPEILVPVNVCYDGYYLSHLTERVEIPSQEDVDRFLAPLSQSRRTILDPENPLVFASFTIGELYAEYRHKHSVALNLAKTKIDEIDGEFKRVFGRGYGGQIEEYRTEDANIVLITMGSHSGTAKVIIDRKRDEGLRIGLIKIRSFRPFPRERLVTALQGKKVIATIDRSVCFGWGSGHLFQEVKAVASDLETRPVLFGFIDGLGGSDITLEHIARVADITHSASQGKPHKEITWLPLE
jgi:pyruvate/2-oxoacid:ferredoxin oxidoreductase alpha subunit